jgi:succinate dehydrogenase/fumarate reductase-like Fe-S protein
MEQKHRHSPRREQSHIHCPSADSNTREISAVVRDRITLRVFRFDPDKDQEPRFDTFDVVAEEGMSVLRAIQLAHRTGLDDLAYRDCNCRRGVCGLCAMMVNGRRVLTCLTLALAEMTIEPLPDHHLIRDLVVQMEKKE